MYGLINVGSGSLKFSRLFECKERGTRLNAKLRKVSTLNHYALNAK